MPRRTCGEFRAFMAAFCLVPGIKNLAFDIPESIVTGETSESDSTGEVRGPWRRGRQCIRRSQILSKNGPNGPAQDCAPQH